MMKYIINLIAIIVEVVLGIAKAFDKVLHKGLISKIKQSTIPGNMR